MTERHTFQMSDLMRVYKVREDYGLFSIDFERTCEKDQFSPETWPQILLALLAREAFGVMARCPKEEGQDYVTSTGMRKCGLSAEAFCQKCQRAGEAKGERGRERERIL